MTAPTSRENHKAVQDAITSIRAVRQHLSVMLYSTRDYYTAWVWLFAGGMDSDAVNPPPEDSHPLEKARRLYFHLLGRFIAGPAYWWQWGMLALSVFLYLTGINLNTGQEGVTDWQEGRIRALFTTESTGFLEEIIGQISDFTTQLTLPFPIIAFFVTMFLIAPAVMQAIYTKPKRQEALGIVWRGMMRGIPPETKEDLVDIWSHDWMTQEGLPTVSEYTELDFINNEIKERSFFWILCAFAVGFSCVPWAGSGMEGFPASLLVLIFILLITQGIIFRFIFPQKLPQSQGKYFRSIPGKNLEAAGATTIITTIIAFLILSGFPADIRPETFAINIPRSPLLAAPPADTATGGFWTVSNVFSSLGILILIGVKLFRDNRPLVLRSRELLRDNSPEAALFASVGGTVWTRGIQSARLQQCEASARDTSPLFTLGTCTGLLAGRGDIYGPTANLPFVLSLQDLTRHLLVLGGTGSGKTAGVLRPLIKQAFTAPKTGLVVMDGKGSLPGEITQLGDIQLINPRDTLVSLVNGLNPVELVDTIVDILGSDQNGSRDSGERFFTESAADLLRKAATIGIFAGGQYWTLTSVARLAFETDFRADAIETLADTEYNSPLLMNAVEFFTNQWSTMDERTRSNIEATARSWINTITSHPDLLQWADAEHDSDGVDLLAPLSGGTMGILIPEYRYKRGGAIATALLKARLYAALKQRAEKREVNDETPVIFVMDEAQEIITREDAAMLAIGRSLGLAVVAATQTIEGIIEKLRKDVADKWLSIYGHLIALAGRSPDTDIYTSTRVGDSWKAGIPEAHYLTINTAVSIAGVTGLNVTEVRQKSLGNITPKVSKPAKIEKEKAKVQTLKTTIGVSPLIYPREISDLLAEPGTAIAVAIRSGVLRRDVIKLSFLYEEELKNDTPPPSQQNI